MKGHAIIGFNHGLLGLAENPALGPGFFRQNTSGYALGVLTPKASPSGWVFSQAQQPMIKTYTHVLISIQISYTLIQLKAWMNNYIHHKLQDVIKYPCIHNLWSGTYNNTYKFL